MKTIIWKETDGLKIVIGFGKRLIDGVATRNEVNQKVSSLAEYKNTVIASKNYTDAAKKKVSQEVLGNLNLKIKEAKIKLDAKVAGLFSSLIKYHETKNGEDVLTKEEFVEYSTLFAAAKKNNKILLMDKTEAVNFKGMSYFMKNGNAITSHVVEKIGDELPVGALLSITEDEKIGLKSIEERLDLFTTEKNKVILDATLLKNEMELTGSSVGAAKTAAENYYSNELDKLKIKYKQ